MKHKCKSKKCNGIICPECESEFNCHEDRKYCKKCGGQMVFEVEVKTVKDNYSERFVN